MGGLPDDAPYVGCVNAVRDTIRHHVHQLVGAGELDLSRPAGDDGLFSPQSMAWRVHGDFTSMMVGGVAALSVQMLHPRALAGVWDHSDWAKNPAGRLKRTAAFVAGTTYGSTATAEALIAKVRRIHDRVEGTLADGTPYRANDPALLTWVHVAEAHAFLRGYLAYRDPGLPAARQDAYYAEMAALARRLGATEVPATRRAVETYLTAMRPQLRADERTHKVREALLGQPATHAMTAPMQRVLLEAGVELMPAWAAAMHGLTVPALKRPAIRMGAGATAGVLRWALAAG